MAKFYEWMKNQYDIDELKEICQHGCANYAPSGMIYYHETTALYDKHREELHQKLGEWMQEIGTPDFIHDTLDCFAFFANAMVWFVAEQYANEIVQTWECQETD